MVKRILLALLLIGLVWGGPVVKADELMDIARASGYEVYEGYRPKSSILIDGNTGDIVWQDNIDESRDPASMSKLMTLYLVYEAIGQGKLTEDTIIRATETDQAISAIHEISNNPIYASVDYTVGDLIAMTLVPSSNVATVMLANYLSNNDPDAFMDMMNAKAKELGMTNSVWNNPGGAGASGFRGYYSPKRYDNSASNQTTARDMAILVYHLTKKYPAILEYTRHRVIVTMVDTPYQQAYNSYNYSLPGNIYGLEGVTGLKTGSSPRAAFNITMTIDRGGQKMIAVIMGVGTWSDMNSDFQRHAFANALIDKAYQDFEYKKVLTAGKHSQDGKHYQVESDLYATVPVGTSPKLVYKDGQVYADNGLDSVSPLIQDSVKAEDTGVLATVNKALVKKQSAEADNQTDFTLTWIGSSLVLLPLALVSYFIFRNEQKNRAQFKERRKSRSRNK
ncbi:DUF1958 domain-containing protein [Streptococcus suis]